MKRHFLAAIYFLAGVITHFHTNAAEVLDKRTIYTPSLNICVSSFGGFILSSEIKCFAKSEARILKTKELLERWINESNSAEFYLRHFESTQFYWQFVETKKFIGAILIVTSDSIETEFYTSLGAGLNVSGNKFYGLRMPSDLNGEVFSFVANKETYQLDYFQNWKFAEEGDEPLEISKFKSRNLLSDMELAAYTGSASNRDPKSETQAEFLFQNKVAKNGYYAFNLLSNKGFVSTLLTLPAH